MNRGRHSYSVGEQKMRWEGKYLTALFCGISLYIDRDSHVGTVASIVPDELLIFSIKMGALEPYDMAEREGGLSSDRKMATTFRVGRWAFETGCY